MGRRNVVVPSLDYEVTYLRHSSGCIPSSTWLIVV